MRKKALKDNDKKQRLFEAAVRLFAQKGYEKTTVDEIAELAEVAKGTVYYHFKSKEELFSFLVEEGMDILKLRISGLAYKELDAREVIKKVISIQLNFFEEYQDICRIILSEAWGISARQEKLQELLNEYYAIVGRLISRGIQEGIIYPQEKEVLAASLFGMTVMVALHYLRKDKLVNWEEIRRQLETLFFRGAVMPQ